LAATSLDHWAIELRRAKKKIYTEFAEGTDDAEKSGEPKGSPLHILGWVGFFLGVAGAEEGGCQDYDSAGFYEEFAAVEPLDGGAFQVGVGEERVVEEGGSGEVDGEVEGFPGAAA